MLWDEQMLKKTPSQWVGCDVSHMEKSRVELFLP
jgi:hypothetical protein